MKWISVQERLPKTFEPVIVCREIGGGEVKVEQGYKDVGTGGRFMERGRSR